MNKSIWTSDWFAGLAISVIFLLAGVFGSFQGLERSAYDLGVRVSSATPSDKVAVIAVDDESIENIGRWPWSRAVHADMLDTIAAGKPKVIGHTVFFLEPQRDPGLAYIDDALTFLDQSSLREVPAAFRGDMDQLTTRLEKAQRQLNTDEILAERLKQGGNTVIGMPFLIGQPQGNPDFQLPDYVLDNVLLNVVDNVSAASNGQLPLPSNDALPPIPVIGQAAAGIGNIISVLDVDGAVRTEPLVVNYYEQYFPSLALLLAAKALNLEPDDIAVRLGEGVQLGQLRIDTDPNLRMHTFYYADEGSKPAFQIDSFFDVLTGKIPPQKYAGKIVLIGASATGVGNPQATPISASMAPVLTLAHAVSSILNEDFFTQPAWGVWVELAIFLLIAAYITALLPRMKAGAAAAVTLGLALLLFGTHLYLMAGPGMWLRLMLPLSLLVAGHLLLTTKRFLVTEQGKLRSEAESAESNRMLGLAFQGQGQLDMAFDKFRKCPMDSSIAELMYNLALDYERKRQFNKAHAIYQHISDFDGGFRDVSKRMERSKRIGETVIISGGSQSGTLMLDTEGLQKPMLGRYQVEKELGKGAMGVVYLGQDPKIDRVVAIKTLALSQEFEADELDDVKARFFREAETAGRLSHPNIVTIFDVGEDQELAYIAMEFLKGEDLTKHIKPGQLLPPRLVTKLMAECADALHYAHTRNVVHRDIKPANVMFDAKNGTLKLTDFGIARITDSSKTKTGMVLGTPSYMSPEQVAGKKVDGRTDLFSLGVMFYQLVTGQLPFQADSMATLMYKIANEEHPPLNALQPDAKPCLGTVVDRALKKDPERRYQNGAQMAKDMRACRQILAAGATS